MGLVGGLLLEETERLAELAGVEPLKQFSEGCVHAAIIEHGQALEPREDKIVLRVPAIAERIGLPPGVLVPLLEDLDEEREIFLADQLLVAVEICELELWVGLALEEAVQFRLVQRVGLVGYYILQGRAHIIRIIEAAIAISIDGNGE